LLIPPSPVLGSGENRRKIHKDNKSSAALREIQYEAPARKPFYDHQDKSEARRKDRGAQTFPQHMLAGRAKEPPQRQKKRAARKQN
jgi:hypothetical protein